MDSDQFAELTAWITEAGFAGQREKAALTGFFERAVALGLPPARVDVLIDTLPSNYLGRALSLAHKKKRTQRSEFGRAERRTLRRMGAQPFLPSRTYGRVVSPASVKRGDRGRILDICRSAG